MKHIGLSAEDLYVYGFHEFTASLGPALEETPVDLKLDPTGEAGKSLAISDAVIRAVAAMIDKNNAALLEHLKHLGALSGGK